MENKEFFTKEAGTQKFLTKKQLSKSGIIPWNPSEAALNMMITRRQIPFRKKSRRVYFIASEIHEWLEAGAGCRLEDIKP